MLPKLSLLALVPFFAAPAVAAPELSFEQQVRPLLKAHCFECHGEGKKLKGGLDVRLRRSLLQGGDTGSALDLSKPAESTLIQRLRSEEMPPGKKKLSRDEIALVERWIAAGAPTTGPEPAALPVGFSITPREQAFWSFQPIRRPALPKVRGSIRTSIDAFLLAKLEAKGMTYAPEAERRTLIRRASFDLLGLPPSPEEVEAFVSDAAPDAYEKLIERLLASPHYGERWGRHWLDVAGYADSEGYSGADPVRKTAYKYRDYVIRSLQADQPFDQFIQEQLAGDEMVRPPYEKLAPAELDKLIATGFLRMAPDGTASPEVDVKAASNQNVADTLQIVSTAILGLTLQCAQCHNHRYDPIPQADYYRLRAVFEPGLDCQNWRVPAAREIPLFKDEERQRAAAIEKEAKLIDAERAAKLREYIEATFAKQLDKIPAEKRALARQAHEKAPAQRTAAQRGIMQTYPFLNVTDGSLYLYDNKAAADLKVYAAKAVKLRATKPAPDFVRALTEVPGKVPVTRLFERGDHEQPTEALTPAHLSVLAPLHLPAIPERNPALPSTGRRLAFAQALTSGQHPLPARVLVNRVWMQHFGKGLVGTPGDFGALGERPTHPELLDWLASDFMAGGWKLKRLHRLVMTSAAYRQSSSANAQAGVVDPDNRLLGHFPVRRLEGEALRDAMLAVSGKLNAKPFGPAIPVTHDEVGQIVIGNDIRISDGTPKGKIASLNGDEYRRSVYVQVRRSQPLAVLETFDGPAMTPNCEVRNASTVSTQALLLLNNSEVLRQAEFFAARLRQEMGTDPRAQVARGWRLAFAAEPTERDVEQARLFVAQQTEQLRGQKQAPGAPEPALQALANFCQALLSANRFLYVD
jgi:mono/diheme cytochrome c family protein